MSKIARTSNSGMGSKTQSGIRPPSVTKPPGAEKKKDGDPNQSKKLDKKTIDFQLPPLSVIGKKKELNFEEIRKKVQRRSNPEGEDKKELASILKHLKDSKAKIRVHEFVQLVARYTADNGEIMRKVLEDDLAAFRKTVTKVYETMTQDVSDVLVNEQIQTANFYQEKHDMFKGKMLGMISEIFQMIPDFDFELYCKDREDHLNQVDPLPVLVVRDATDIDVQRRQEAFHRLQWLKIEGGRLAKENKRLEQKLASIRDELDQTQAKASLKAHIMKEKMHDLEEQEHEKQDHLHELEGILGKTAVRAEAYTRLEQDEASRMAKPPPKDAHKKKSKKHLRRPEWSSVTAADMEGDAARELVVAESAAADDKKRHKRIEREELGPSQFSSSEMEYPTSVVKMQERTVQQTTSVTQERRILPQQSTRGRCQGPKDTWGGFY